MQDDRRTKAADGDLAVLAALFGAIFSGGHAPPRRQLDLGESRTDIGGMMTGDDGGILLSLVIFCLLLQCSEDFWVEVAPAT